MSKKIIAIALGLTAVDNHIPKNSERSFHL